MKTKINGIEFEGTVEEIKELLNNKEILNIHKQQQNVNNNMFRKKKGKYHLKDESIRRLKERMLDINDLVSKGMSRKEACNIVDKEKYYLRKKPLPIPQTLNFKEKNNISDFNNILIFPKYEKYNEDVLIKFLRSFYNQYSYINFEVINNLFDEDEEGWINFKNYLLKNDNLLQQYFNVNGTLKINNDKIIFKWS